MKQLILVIISTVVFILFTIYINIYLSESSQKVNQHLDNIRKYCDNSQWDKAYAETESITKTWHKTKNKWAMITEHDEIDMIEMSIEKVKEYVKVRDIAEVSAESANLKLLIKHIPEKYKLNLENIF